MNRQRTLGKRFQRGGLKVGTRVGEFVNPYSWESQPEARVQLELEARHLSFSYRYFMGNAPITHKLIPDFNPEFTLPDYKIVIMVQGAGFFGQLPGAIDKSALASVLLEKDGWKAVIWSEDAIRQDGVATLMDRELPQLRNAAFLGIEIPSPYGHPLTMETRRNFLRGLALLRALFTPQTVEGATNVRPRTRSRYLRRSDSDGTRYRPSGQRPLQDTD